MLKRHFDNFLTKLIDWWFRVATIERYENGGAKLDHGSAAMLAVRAA